MKNPGHYFCSYCNDVKHVRFTERHEVCPDCKNHSMTWVAHVEPHRKPRFVSSEEAVALFQEVKNSANREALK